MGRDMMQRQRFELKYRLDEELALQIRDYTAEYLQLDENGVGKPAYSYHVHSLYLDSEDLATYWMTINGDKNRFKLRIRFYDEKPESPVFFEIKRRMDNCILKQRGGVHKDAVGGVLTGQLPQTDQLVSRDPRHLVAIQRFIELMQFLEASPKMHVAYLREAWVEPNNDAVRVTFDRAVRGQIERTTRFSTGMSHPVRPFGHDIILELKFTNRFPLWLREMVEKFDLTRCGAAKYCECVDAIGEERLAAKGSSLL
jgi:VTC domain